MPPRAGPCQEGKQNSDCRGEGGLEENCALLLHTNFLSLLWEDVHRPNCSRKGSSWKTSRGRQGREGRSRQVARSRAGTAEPSTGKTGVEEGVSEMWNVEWVPWAAFSVQSQWGGHPHPETLVGSCPASPSSVTSQPFSPKVAQATSDSSSDILPAAPRLLPWAQPRLKTPLLHLAQTDFGCRSGLWL